MTYNFDPDRWYENERSSIDARHRAGDLRQAEFEKAVEDLDHKYQEMWDRLDGSYQIPERS